MGSGTDEVEELRREIDQTRENLGAAVGGLAYKADVKNRGKEVLEDKKEMVMEKVDELKSKLPGGGDDAEGGFGDKIKAKLPSGDDVSDKVDALKDKLPDTGALKDKLPDTGALKDKLPSGVGDAAGTISDKTPSKDEVKEKAHGALETAKEHPAAIAGGAALAGLAAGLALPETDLEREKLKPHVQKARADVTSKVQDTVAQIKSGVQDAAGSVTDAVREQAQQGDGKVAEIAEKAADKADAKVGNA